MSFFRKSNEEKFVSMICNINKKQLDDDLSSYGKYERMRQTWKKDGSGNLNLSNKKAITEQDVINVENFVRSTCPEILQTEEYKTYMEFLKGILELEVRYSLYSKDEKFEKSKAVNKKVYEYLKASTVFTNNFKKIVQDKSDFKTIEKTLNAVEIMMKTNTSNKTLQECKNYLYFMLQQFEKSGKKSAVKLSLRVNAAGQIVMLRRCLDEWMEEFYTAKAKKVFDKYKKIYDLVIKCDEKKVIALFNGDLKSKKYTYYSIIMGKLLCLATDAGREDVVQKLKNF